MSTIAFEWQPIRTFVLCAVALLVFDISSKAKAFTHKPSVNSAFDTAYDVSFDFAFFDYAFNSAYIFSLESTHNAPDNSPHDSKNVVTSSSIYNFKHSSLQHFMYGSEHNYEQKNPMYKNKHNSSHTSTHKSRHQASLYTTSVPATFASFRWQHRILFVQASSKEELNELTKKIHLQQEAISERKLRIFVLFDNTTKEPLASHNKANKLHKATDVRAIMGNKYAVLVGLDGGLKAYYDSFILREVFADIDGMPMRRAEINRQ